MTVIWVGVLVVAACRSEAEVRGDDACVGSKEDGWVELRDFEMQGSAVPEGHGGVRLTPAETLRVGTAVHTEHQFRGDSLSLTFEFYVDAPPRGDGLTLTVLDAQRVSNDERWIGGHGGCLGVGTLETAGAPEGGDCQGFAWVEGWSLEIDTYSNAWAGDSESQDHLAVAQDGWLSEPIAGPWAIPLGEGWHRVALGLKDHVLKVEVDRRGRFSTAVPELHDGLSLLGFTAATGSEVSAHRVREVRVDPASCISRPW